MPLSQPEFDFSRGAQLNALRRLRLPDGVSKDGSTVRAATLLAVLRTLDDRCGKNGEQWWDQATLGKQAGISARTVSKALQVLESMHLIEKTDTRRGGARRLVISINWHTVFGDVEPYQDPTILVAWGLLGDGRMASKTGQSDPVANSELESFNSELSSEFNSEVCSELIRKPVPNSLLSKTPNDPPTLCEGEWVSGSLESFTTKAGRHEDGSEPEHGMAATRIQSGASSPAIRVRSKGGPSLRCCGDLHALRVDHGRSRHEDRTREPTDPERVVSFSGPQPSALSREPSPMPIRTIDPREQTLIDRLIELDVGDGRKALRESLRIGYTVDQVGAILDWYESLILVDPASGERVVPYWPGALVIRLRDEDSRRALPSQGKWGGKRGEWTALQLRLSGPTPGLARVPDHSLARRSGVIESLTREQVEQILQELIDRGGTLGERAGKCLGWMQTGWPEGANLIVPPGNVTRFLMQVDVEALIRK